MAAEVPSSTKKSVNIQPRSNWLQLQLVVKSACNQTFALQAEGRLQEGTRGFDVSREPN